MKKHFEYLLFGLLVLGAFAAIIVLIYLFLNLSLEYSLVLPIAFVVVAYLMGRGLASTQDEITP